MFGLFRPTLYLSDRYALNLCSDYVGLAANFYIFDQFINFILNCIIYNLKQYTYIFFYHWLEQNVYKKICSVKTFPIKVLHLFCWVILRIKILFSDGDIGITVARKNLCDHISAKVWMTALSLVLQVNNISVQYKHFWGPINECYKLTMIAVTSAILYNGMIIKDTIIIL